MPNQYPSLSPQLAEVIQDASRIVGCTLDTHCSIRGILELLSNKLDLTQGRVVLPDPDTGLLHIAFSHDLSDGEIGRGTYALGEGVTGRVMATGEIAVIPDVSKEPAYVAHVSALKLGKDDTVAYLAVPIMRDDTAIGVLAAHRRKTVIGDFDSDLYILQIMAAMIGQALQIHELIEQQTHDLKEENKALRDKRRQNHAVHGIIGKSAALRESIERACKAAASETTVMLVGESGSGKERFARMIHLASERREKPFVCINCAAIPANLLESELFGHEKGAFTGATSARPGKFEIAAGGTLFLDEIGDMTLDLQAKLLRVLQERTVQRIGSNTETPVDVRIISATNRRLQEDVNNGDFRLDLFYRLNVIRIALPPLRQRKDDIDVLAFYFLNRCNQMHKRNVMLSDAAFAQLKEYEWPGNVRQLENVIERLVIMSDTDVISEQTITAILHEESGVMLEETERQETGRIQISSAELMPRPYSKVQPGDREAILNALNKTRGNKTLAARTLGMTPRQLHYRLDKLNINI
jgi:Nif-specific regulatory protein